jgi:hypothetical protein
VAAHVTALLEHGNLKIAVEEMGATHSRDSSSDDGK